MRESKQVKQKGPKMINHERLTRIRMSTQAIETKVVKSDRDLIREDNTEFLKTFYLVVVCVGGICCGGFGSWFVVKGFVGWFGFGLGL